MDRNISTNPFQAQKLLMIVYRLKTSTVGNQHYPTTKFKQIQIKKY